MGQKNGCFLYHFRQSAELLSELHLAQAGTKLLVRSWPPFERGLTWSSVNEASSIGTPLQ